MSTTSQLPSTARLQVFPLPDVGEGLTEADILSWKVAPGDAVTVNQIIVEIETAKAAVELPSPFAGVVHELLAQVGQTVAVGVPIIAIDTQPDAGPLTGGEPEVAAEAGSKIGEVMADGRIATLVGYITPSGGSTRRPRKGTAGSGNAIAPAAQTPVAVAPAVPARAAQEPVAGSTAESPTYPDRAPLATPPVRKLAKDLGVNLWTLSATGPGGLVSRRDVEMAAGATVEEQLPQVLAGTASGFQSERGEIRVPIKGVRKMTAAAMVASAFTAPHVTEFLSVDVTELLDLRDRLKRNRQFSEVKLTPLVFVARAVCAMLQKYPDLNARWDEAASEIVYPQYVNLGIAAATPRGLLVPNIKGADRLGLGDLALELADLTSTAREGKTSPAAMAGGTFTITNIGVFGVDTGTPILNPGESGILAVGSIKDTAWVVNGQLAVRKVCQLALSFDHRLVDGEAGSRFLADVGAALADPALAYTW